MKRSGIAWATALLAACGGQSQQAEEPAEPAGAVLGQRPNLPPQVNDFPALASTDCADVAAFYFDALSNREYRRAALVWDDPVIDGARLEAVFREYAQARIEQDEPSIEGAAGSLYCTIQGQLTDAGDADKPAVQGTLVLRRINDVPGATPEQLRWTLQSSTFVENLERSSRG